MATVRLDRVVKVYPGDHTAVNGIDLTIDDGEFFVLVGPSGCGKTSVLRMIAGFETATSGSVHIDGRAVDAVATRDRGVAMLFQECVLYPHMTVRANLAFPLELAGMGRREIRRRVDEVARVLGLAGLLDRPPGRLSGGQQQRVAMGRVLVREPSVLLMDEPMSNLDAKLRTELRAEIAMLQRRLGVTTVYVTHDQVEAMALGDRAGVMRAGRIVQCAPPQELYQHPTDIFVATFVGSPPMNVLGARVVASDGGFGLSIGPNLVSLGGGQRWPELARWLDRDVVVGIRPESCAPADGSSSRTIRVEITHIEHLGSAQLVTATVGAPAVALDGDDVVIDECPASSIHIYLDGEVEVDLWRPVDVEVDVDLLHLFDPATGTAIGSVDRVAHG